MYVTRSIYYNSYDFLSAKSRRNLSSNVDITAYLLCVHLITLGPLGFLLDGCLLKCDLIAVQLIQTASLPSTHMQKGELKY
jgi:hypothetical protein